MPRSTGNAWREISVGRKAPPRRVASPHPISIPPAARRARCGHRRRAGSREPASPDAAQVTGAEHAVAVTDRQRSKYADARPSSTRHPRSSARRASSAASRIGPRYSGRQRTSPVLAARPRRVTRRHRQVPLPTAVHDAEAPSLTAAASGITRDTLILDAERRFIKDRARHRRAAASSR